MPLISKISPNEGICKVDFYDNPDLKGNPIYKLDDKGLWHKDELVCKKYNFGTTKETEILKSNDYSFESFMDIGCKKT